MSKSVTVKVNVKGKPRKVYLGTKLEDNKWRGRVIVNDLYGDRTSVAGIYQVYQNGTRRFTPTGKNSSLLW